MGTISVLLLFKNEHKTIFLLFQVTRASYWKQKQRFSYRDKETKNLENQFRLGNYEQKQIVF